MTLRSIVNNIVIVHLNFVERADCMLSILTTHTHERGTREPGNVIGLRIALIVVLASLVQAYVQTHQIIYNKHLQAFTYYREY